MAWNQPSGPNNPWGRRPGQGGPDLDERLKSWQRRLEAWLRPGGRGGDSGSLFLIAALVVLGGWVFSGFYQVEQAQRGIIQRFGKLVDIKAPGVGWRWPWHIETVTKVNVANVNSSDFKSRVLTSDVNLVELHFAVQYQFVDPVKKLFQVHDPEATLTEVSESAIREIVGRSTLDELLVGSTRPEITRRTKELIQHTLEYYNSGTTLTTASLEDMQVPGAEIPSQRDANKAQADKERFILESEAYANGIVPVAQGAALRDGNDAVGVGLGLEDEALLVGLRLVGVALRGDLCAGHLHVLEARRRERSAGVVVLERMLDELLRTPGDLRPGRADQQLVQCAASHDLADRALAHLGQRRFRIVHLEQLLHRIHELVLNREVQLDQVYVGGQHPGLEVARVHVRDVELRHRLDGPGPAPSDPRGLDVDQLPEALDDAALGLLDLVEAAEHPAAEHHERRDQEQRAAVPAAAPGPEPRLEPALPALQALVQIRSPLTGTASPRIVRTAWLIPGHSACANSAQLGRARDGGRL